jgi:hypothetical protein
MTVRVGEQPSYLGFRRRAALAAFFLALGLFLSGVRGEDVQVSTLAGERVAGKLAALLPDALELQTAAGARRIPLQDLEGVDFSRRAVEARPKFLVELLDGSRLAATVFTLASGKAQLELTSGVTAADLPTRAMRSVKFVPAIEDPAETKGWGEIAVAESTGDVLVVRKRGEGNQLTLDQLEGAIQGVTPEGVKFNFDGDEITVKFEKLAGLIFFQPVKRELPAAVGRLFDVGGSQFSLRTLELKTDSLAVLTSAGLAANIPLAAAARIDFSSGNIAYLAELARDQPPGAALALVPRGLDGSAAQWFAPRVEVLPQPQPLGPGGAKRYRRLIALPSQAALTYAIPEGFARLHASVGLDPALNPAGEFELAIVANGKVLWSQAFSAARKNELVEIDLPLPGVQRLVLRTTPLRGQGIGSWIHLYEARLTK